MAFAKAGEKGKEAGAKSGETGEQVAKADARLPRHRENRKFEVQQRESAKEIFKVCFTQGIYNQHRKIVS